MKRWFKWLFISLGVLTALIVIFYLEENWRGAREWAKVSAELKAKGYPLTIKETIPPPIPDEDNIAAAPIFAELFDANGGENKEARLIKAKSFSLPPEATPNFSKGEVGDLRFYFGKPKFTMTEQEAAQKIFAELDKEWTPLLAEVAEALKRPQCRWPLAYEKGIYTPMPQLNANLNLVKTLQLRALAYLASGQSEKAADDIITGCQLSRTLEADACLIQVLVATAEQGILLNPLWDGLVKRSWKDNDLERIQHALSETDGLQATKSAYPRELSGFIVIAHSTKKSLRAIIGELIVAKKLKKLFRDTGIGEYGYGMIVLVGFRPSGWADLDCSAYARTMDDLVNSIDSKMGVLDVKKVKYIRQRVFESSHSIPILQPLTTLSLQGVSLMPQKVAESGTRNRQAVIACALERYRLANGAVPDKLEALMPRYLDKLPVQVVNGEPFIYRKVDAHDYVLYSVGWDLKDDGGKWSKSREKGDWVWASKPELYQELQ